MRTFLFLALRDPALTARLIRAGGRTGATVILDLEDALWDVDDPQATAALKATGRQTLVTLARDHGELFRGQPIGVRMNAIRGPEAAADLDALGRAAAAGPLDLVVLPKVEAADDLAACAESLRRHRVVVGGLMPILETRRAMANLDLLLAAARAAGAGWVVYGHYDLALDAGWWPFPEHSSAQFWDRVLPFAERVEAAGLGYVHPPYLRTNDEAGLLRGLGRVGSACRREFGFLAVGLGQAQSAARLATAGAPAPETRPAATEPPAYDDPLALAMHVVETYRANRSPEIGFAVDRRTGEFIPPHGYLAARRFLAGSHRG